MSGINREKLEAMDDSTLETLHADLETQWKYYDRRPDPHLTYTALQDEILADQRLIKEVQAARRASEGQGS